MAGTKKMFGRGVQLQEYGSARGLRDFRIVEIRVKKIVAELSEMPVDKTRPEEIDG
jgi:hypothetical protein